MKKETVKCTEKTIDVDQVLRLNHIERFENPEWVFQFNDDEPVKIPNVSAKELIIIIGNNSQSNICFYDGKGNKFKIFAKENKIKTKKTAVDFLIESIMSRGLYTTEMLEDFELAKEMDKEQKKDAWYDGLFGKTDNFQQYYNETFNK